MSRRKPMTLQDAMTLLESLQNANSDESDSDEDFMDDYLCTGEDYIPPPLDSSSESDSDTFTIINHPKRPDAAHADICPRR